jgi:hypothetical protein
MGSLDAVLGERLAVASDNATAQLGVEHLQVARPEF